MEIMLTLTLALVAATAQTPKPKTVPPATLRSTSLSSITLCTTKESGSPQQG